MLNSLAMRSPVQKLAHVAILLLSTSLSAQVSAPQLAALLETQIRGRAMLVRDFLANPVIHYAWNGTAFVHDPQSVFTAGVFTASSITVTGPADSPQKLVIKGKLQTVLRQEDSGPYKTFPLEIPTRFEVDLAGADQNAITSIGSRLFYPDLTTMLAAVPPEWKSIVPDLIKLPDPTFAPAHGAWIRQDGIWRELAPGDKI